MSVVERKSKFAVVYQSDANEPYYIEFGGESLPAVHRRYKSVCRKAKFHSVAIMDHRGYRMCLIPTRLGRKITYAAGVSFDFDDCGNMIAERIPLATSSGGQ